VKYKEGDEEKFCLHAQTTDKILVFATDGRFFTIPCDKISRGKGQGDPIRHFIDLDNEHDLVQIAVYTKTEKLLVASTAGKGLVVNAEDVEASTKNGKQILNLTEGARAQVCRVVVGDHVAVIGDNRKLLVFPLNELPEMRRGQGVSLQKYKDGGLADAKTFKKSEGLSWKSGERMRVEQDITAWLGHRGTPGKLPPTGFPRSNQFD
jgi:topoisomerase IV subunit A